MDIATIRRLRGWLCLACLGMAFPASASGAWPQFRCDSYRSGYTAERLPDELRPAWRREARHAPEPAWMGRPRDQSRMRFDYAYHAVMGDGRVYFGSSADGKVYALDAKTGEERWHFFTQGPVRFAPVLFKDKVLAASDDGYLYCLSSMDGSLVWKKRGGPGDEYVVGNGRIISRWPARGGPVLRDGIVYFAAGIWPTEGVYIHAVDADTGRTIWLNDHSGALEIGQPHMLPPRGGVVCSPGYLAATDQFLLVATGRAPPASFNRTDGAFRFFHYQKLGGKSPSKLGDSEIVASERAFFNTGYVFDQETGLAYQPVDPWRHWAKKPALSKQAVRIRGTVEQFVVTPGGILHSSNDELYFGAIEWKPGRVSQSAAFYAVDVPEVHNGDSIKADGEILSVIVAGDKIVVGTPGRISIYRLEDRRQLEEFEVTGNPLGLAAAGGSLIVSTDTGALYCFSERTGTARTTPATFSQAVFETNEEAEKAALKIIEQTGVMEGYCVDLGCGSGHLSWELAKRTGMRIVAVAEAPEQAAMLRERFDRAGLPGSRITVMVLDLKQTQLPEYFANLVVSGAALDKGVEWVPMGEAKRIQRPWGGTIWLSDGERIVNDVRGPLAGAGQWTHHAGSAAHTLSSTDQRVRAPFKMQWYKDPTLVIPQRHGKGPTPLFYNGILVQAGLEGVRATDAYNGRTLWEIKLPGLANAFDENTSTGEAVTGGMCCIDDDTLFIRQENFCTLVDLQKGRVLGRYEAPTLPDGRRSDWTYIASEDGLLFGGVGNCDHVITANHGGGDAGFSIPTEHLLNESSLLFAMDAGTGELKWTFEPRHSIRNNAIAVGNGQVYLIDREAATIDTMRRSLVREMQRAGDSDRLPVHRGGNLVALDARTGATKWIVPDDAFGTYLALSEETDTLVMAFQEHAWKINSETGGRLAGYRASTGKKLWERKLAYYNIPVLIGERLYAHPYMLDLLTGEHLETVNAHTGKREPLEMRGKTFGCAPMTGCPNVLFCRSGTLGYADLVSYRGRIENYSGFRPGCWISALPAGGLVLVPDNTSGCSCSYENQASFALIHGGAPPPDIHPDGAVFKDAVTVSMTSVGEDVQIRYTLDGMEPGPASLLYQGPFELSRSTAVKAAVFRGEEKLNTLDVRHFVRTGPVPPVPDIHLGDLADLKTESGLDVRGKKQIVAKVVARDTTIAGRPLELGGRTFDKGLSALAFSEFAVPLASTYRRFVARVGVGRPGGTVAGGQATYENIIRPSRLYIKVVIDGKTVHQSPRLGHGSAPWNIDLEIPAGAKELRVYAILDEANSREHWHANAAEVNWVHVGFTEH